MAKIIAIANQKGGVAKTTTTGALAAGLKQKGFLVLAVDVDPQGNMSDAAGADNVEKETVFDLLKGDTTAQETIQQLENFDIIPANITLAVADQVFSDIGKEQRLKERLSEIVDQYDYILIDTPPALGFLTINAFTAADEIIIPTTPGIFAATGIKQLYDTVQQVKKYCNAKVKIAGVLLTRFDPRTNNNKDMRELTEQLATYMDARLYKTYIRNSVVVEEAQARKIDLFTYKKNSAVAEDYANFVDEYLKGEKQ